MNIETKKLSDLIAAPYNPRKISPEAYKGLQASIKKFGIVQPIVWNWRTGHVVSGHQRLKVLHEMGETETTVISVDLSEDDEKALNITQNSPYIAGAFDNERLEEVLSELKESEYLDLKALRLDVLYDLDVNIPEFEPIEEDDAPEEIKPKVHTCPECGHEWS